MKSNQNRCCHGAACAVRNDALLPDTELGDAVDDTVADADAEDVAVGSADKLSLYFCTMKLTASIV